MKSSMMSQLMNQEEEKFSQQLVKVHIEQQDYKEKQIVFMVANYKI